MWEFIRILFLSAIVSITGGKKDFATGNYQFDLGAPIVAINEGALVYVDVSSMAPRGQTLAMRREWASRFPRNCMAIKLIPKEASYESVYLTYQGGISYTGDSLYLLLVGDKAIPRGVQYMAVEFKTTVPLNSAELIWKNYGE